MAHSGVLSLSTASLRPEKRLRRAASVATVAALAVAGLAACGGTTEKAPATTVAVGEYPAYYPAGYDDIIAGSKAEGGTLEIYSNTDQANWNPIFRDFTRKYPWVKNIKANNLDSDEVFQRILSEGASGTSPADVAVTNAAHAWADFAKRDNALLPYESAESSKLPDFAKPLPNVYAFSEDPVTLVYNDELIGDTKPTGIASLGSIVAADPDKFKNKISARAVDGSFGFTVSHAFADATPAAWTSLQQVLSAARPEDSSGTQIEKITSGEYLAGFFVSGAVAYPAETDSDGLFKVVYPDDGTPVLPRGIGIVSSAPHPNTGKLFVDFLLSQEGQQAVAEGGLTSYRDGVTAGFGIHTYQELVQKIGADKVIQVKYESTPEADVNAFVKKWTDMLSGS
jgi:iron(III) transport system substrate-binding protein